jgi:uncharacterized membrane protein
MRAPRLHRALLTSQLLLPMLGILAGIVLAITTTAVDRATHYRLVPQSVTGTPTDAQWVLSTFATATASLTTLVLTITLVAIQLAMGQFSPRIVGALLNDRFSRGSIGLFGATFVVAVLTLRAVRDTGSGQVPGLSVLVAYVLMFASVVVLVLFVNHAQQGLRSSALIDLVGDRTRALLVHRHPDALPVDVSRQNEVVALRPGNVIRVDRPGLVALARRADCVLELVPMVGDFVAGGMPLLRIHLVAEGAPGPQLRRRDVEGLVVLGPERVHTEDLAYGFRKLVDIAERSIAEPFQDPTTAVQALHRLHDLLRQLAGVPFPSGEHRDDDGVLRLVERTMTWDGFVRLAFDEVRLAGAGEPQISRRLCAALEDLKTVALPYRQGPLDLQLRLLEAGVRRAYADEEDVVAALTPDTEGIGSGPDVTTVARLDARVGRAQLSPGTVVH